MASSEPASEPAREIPRPPAGDLPALLRFQGTQCGVGGSAIYERLLLAAAADVEEGGPCLDVLRGHERDPFGTALALRFMGGVHRLVLDGGAPALAALLPVGRRLDRGGRPAGSPSGRRSRTMSSCCASGSATACRRTRSVAPPHSPRAFSPLPSRPGSRCGCSRWAPAPRSTCGGTAFATTTATRHGATRSHPCGSVRYGRARRALGACRRAAERDGRRRASRL